MDNLHVAGIPDSALLAARLRDAVGPGGVVHLFNGADEAIGFVARGEVDCSVIAVDASSFDRDIGHIRRIREAFPGHPIVAWCEMRSLSSRQLLDIAEFSIADLAFRGMTDSRHPFAQLLSSALQRASARQLDSRLSALFPDSIRPVFVMALERASEPLDVERAAAAFGITRRTLFNRLVHHGLPRPQTFLLWCRLLVAGTLLDERGRTLDAVALQLGFSTGQNLGAALRRYVGTNIKALRQGNVSPAVEAEFRRIITRGRARAVESRRKRRSDSLPAPSPAD